MPYTQVTNGRKTLLLITLTVIITVLTTVGYLSTMRWNLRRHTIAQVEKSGCIYLGRILGTTDVIVMRCNNEIKLEEYKE